MNKASIKNFAVWARRKLISEITYKAGIIGINENGVLLPLENSTDTIEFYDIGTGKPTELSVVEIKQRQSLVSHIKKKEDESDYKTAFQFVVEEVAYTWFNRLVAIRFMEVNEYLPSGIRVLSSEMLGKAEPDMVTTPFETDMSFSSYETDRIIQMKDENKLDELFRMLFIKQCNKLNEVLPELFEKTNDYTEFLLNISFTDKDDVVSHLVNDVVEDDFKEAVEIIGWLYQYYNTEPKEQVFVNLKKNIKITKDNIPAATQLFTPDWIVRYMTENSLGHLWLAGHPNDSLKSGWKYYLEEAEQEQFVQDQLKEIRENYKKLKPEDIKIIDPCMGSGHILVYVFDVLMQIYESQGYTQRDAACAIIENNLYGLDIDERAYQLAYFALMMKARQYDYRFLTRRVFPQVYCPKDYAEGQEFGSLLNVETLEPKPQEPKELTIFNIDWKKEVNTWNFRRLLAQKYDVVITNPPYMGGSGMNGKLSDYVKENFPDSKSDLFAVFIERCLQLTKQNGFSACITPPSVLFLSSFEKLRKKMLSNTISSLLHMGRGIFGIDFGSTAFVIKKSAISKYNSCYFRLHERTFQYIDPSDIEKLFLMSKGDCSIKFNFSLYDTSNEGIKNEEISTNKNIQLYFETQQENFSKIPGSPIAYWVSEQGFEICNTAKTFESYATTRAGMITGNNDLFIRLWYEVDVNKFGIHFKNRTDASKSNMKWFPYNKGGDFRKWFGNNEYVVDWQNDGYFMRNFRDQSGKIPAHAFNLDYIFKENITWSSLSSYKFAARYTDFGFLYDASGSFADTQTAYMKYTLAMLSSEITLYFLSAFNPTLNFQKGNIANLPLIISMEHKPRIDELVEQNISLSKTDWDSFENSWEFTKHSLVQSSSIQSAFEVWEQECTARFTLLKSNEEELNRIFIDIYGLQDELTPEVEDKDVTVRKANLTRDIKSFVSYAVGCMFGRYSLDVEGISYAGGDWDDSKYDTFIPDADNCIPITDEEYFEDDIVGLFVTFVKKVYGVDTLEENLDFIAKVLGNKGNTSREIIRNYFMKDFYKDHVKIYQRRPIYWLYDSGKQEGFKALIYMHRYNEDTTGKVRVEYLHKMQKTYMNEINRMLDEIENGKTVADIAKAEKRKEKLVKQLKETKEYDEKIAHLALSRIVIDLDDGVKVNYEKVQTSQDGKSLDILKKI